MDVMVLVVDDEHEICDLLQMYLEQEGYRVHCVHDGIAALDAVSQFQPDIILLDILLPKLGGIEVCSHLRRQNDVPILFISCKGEDVDKIIALGIGGDDYVVKPFSPREVVARVKALMRRRRQLLAPNEIVYGNLRIDLSGRIVYAKGKKVRLSGTEFELLCLLARNPGVIYSAEEIFRKLWVNEPIEDTRTVMVHISNLRKKIESEPARPNCIITVWGAGYKFNGAPGMHNADM